VFFEQILKTLREWVRGSRFVVSIFEDVIEEFIGEGGEVINGRSLRVRRGRSIS